MTTQSRRASYATLVCLLIVALSVIMGCPVESQTDISSPPINTTDNLTGVTPDESPGETLGATEKPADEPNGESDNDGHEAKPNENEADPDSKTKPARRKPLFVDWPDPQFVLLVSGRQDGYIEPCGCTGLANQKGGLVRRYALRKQLIERGWEVVPLDVGNQVRRFGRQPEIKFGRTVEAMRLMGYRAIAFGPDDLRLFVNELARLTADADEDNPSEFVCANTAVIAREWTPRFHLIEARDKKIGVTAVLSTEHQKKIVSDEIVKQPAEEALREVWSELEGASCDLYVLLAHASIEESKQLAQQFPKFDVVVTAGGAGEPTYEAEKIPDTDAILVQVGTKGTHVGVVGVYDDEKQPLRYQRVPLDARFTDSPEMLKILATYQEELKAEGLGGLGLKAIPHPSDWTFVGSDACEDCHEEEYEIWEDTPHAEALDSLVHPSERSEIPRHFDPECIVCHVTGWSPPPSYLPYRSGYLNLDETPAMQNVGCENCHGPGSAHVDAEVDEDATDELLEKLREAMRLGDEAEKKCMECHDLDNSPDFHLEGAFKEYWEQVEH